MKTIVGLGIIFALVVTKLEAAKDGIATDWSCYEFGEDIRISYSNALPTMQNWIGIYDAEDAKSQKLGNPSQWFRFCGSQDPLCKTTNDITLKQEASPLKPGVYVAYLHAAGYHGRTASISSKPFMIKKKGQRCDSEDTIFTEKTSYVVGEELKVAFENSSLEQRDVVGIFPADSNLKQLGDPLLWLRTCGDQKCEVLTFGDIDHGVLSFGTYSLSDGIYIAVLGRQRPNGEILAAIASEPFRVHLNAACNLTVSALQKCYLRGEYINVEYDDCGTQATDKIAIYPATLNLEDDLGEPLTWVYSCGNKNCGNVIKSSSQEVHPGVWPLNEGYYKVVVIRKNNGGRSVTYASQAFRVAGMDATCSDEKPKLRASRK